jgi:hypothetical protein
VPPNVGPGFGRVGRVELIGGFEVAEEKSCADFSAALMDLEFSEVFKGYDPTALRDSAAGHAGAATGDGQRRTGGNAFEDFVLVPGDYDFFRVAGIARGVFEVVQISRITGMIRGRRWVCFEM